jgi:hypothetical protein
VLRDLACRGRDGVIVAGHHGEIDAVADQMIAEARERGALGGPPSDHRADLATRRGV